MSIPLLLVLLALPVQAAAFYNTLRTGLTDEERLDAFPLSNCLMLVSALLILLSLGSALYCRLTSAECSVCLLLG